MMLLFVILLFILMMLHFTLNNGMVSNLQEQLMLTSKLESDLEDAMYWARRDLLISLMEKT